MRYMRIMQQVNDRRDRLNGWDLLWVVAGCAMVAAAIAAAVWVANLKT
ncbi:MAG: hypothetical protein KGL39_36725 [Patescibacteria group bacterium]|nr:hypothetical protein [Patescibacteria group bacterium]